MNVLWLAAIAATACALDAHVAEALGARRTTTIHVDDDAPVGGDGSGARPFSNLTEAIEAASTKTAPIVKLAPGVYTLRQLLTIDFSVELRGSQEMLIDEMGWPTGIVPGTETEIVGVAPAPAPSALISFGRADNRGPALEDVKVRDLTFVGSGESANAPGGSTYILQFWKTQGYLVKACVFRNGGRARPAGVFSNASSGRIVGNLMTGIGVGAIAGAGSTTYPARVEFVGNRSSGNTNGGILANGGAPGIPDTDADTLDVEITGNDLSENTTNSFGFGVRIFTIRRDPGHLGSGQSKGHVTAHITGNRLHGNETAFTFDAGFPYREYQGPRCDRRVYSGTFDVSLRDNSVSGSKLAPALISFTRSSAMLAPATLRLWQYLHGSIFTIDDPQGALAGYLLDHPEKDPLIGGACATDADGTSRGPDATNEPLGNQLIYNGATVAHTP